MMQPSSRRSKQIYRSANLETERENYGFNKKCPSCHQRVRQNAGVSGTGVSSTIPERPISPLWTRDFAHRSLWQCAGVSSSRSLFLIVFTPNRFYQFSLYFLPLQTLILFQTPQAVHPSVSTVIDDVLGPAGRPRARLATLTPRQGPSRAEDSTAFASLPVNQSFFATKACWLPLCRFARKPSPPSQRNRDTYIFTNRSEVTLSIWSVAICTTQCSRCVDSNLFGVNTNIRIDSVLLNSVDGVKLRLKGQE